jgi:hypothetical protein
MVRELKVWFIIISACLFNSCANNRSKETFKWTDVICNHLYVETYILYNRGTEGAERLSQYLTDSASFRIHIGNIVQGRDFNSYECSGDTINVHKKIYGEIDETRKYSVSSLKEQRKFE